MLVDPQIAGWFGLSLLWAWIKKEPWFSIPLLLSLLGLFLCGAPHSFMHRAYDTKTIAQMTDFFTAVMSIDLFLILCRRKLNGWLIMGIPIISVIWLTYAKDGKVRTLNVALFCTVFVIAGIVVSSIWPDKGQLERIDKEE